MQQPDSSPSIQQQLASKEQQADVYSLPLPIRIKHPSWSVRKGTYQQLLYYLKTITSPNQEILISGASYTVQTLLPYFENLILQKHATVLFKGLQCVQQILLLDKKAHSKHCIRSLIDKGIQFFPLLSQSRKAILQKFLDLLQLSKIEATFLKNKLSLPHEKSVMYVIEVIGVLNITSLKAALVGLSKKHQKKCVRQLAAEIAEQLEDDQAQDHKQKPASSSNQLPTASKSKPSINPSCKYTIQKLPHFEQFPSKKQQQFSSELSQKIESIIDEYTFSQLPNFSHILRLMMDDNNHIINVNAIKCLIAIFEREKEEGKGSLVPVSFPLLFLFAKFKSHKTHPINFLMLSLIEAILKSTNSRVNDLFQAISEGLTSAGSKANVKFGCGLSFFRAISLLYKSQDLYNCTINENIENENEDMHEKFSKFDGIKLGKSIMKAIEKIMGCLEKDKKYETEIYLIKYAIGLDAESLGNQKWANNRDLIVTNNKSPKYSQHKETNNKIQQVVKQKKNDLSLANEKNLNKKPQNSVNVQPSTKQKTHPSQSLSLTKSTKQSKSVQKFQQINLEQTLTRTIKLLNSQLNETQLKKTTLNQLTQLLQKSSQEFYQCVKQRRFQMFYLCQLLEHFIENYQPNDLTIEKVSEYLINLLKIISLLKPLSLSSTSTQSREISLNNVSQLFLVALCKLVIGEEIHEVLENINQNYGYEVIFETLDMLFVNKTTNKIKKKNRKSLLLWLEGNTPALYLNKEYYRLVDALNEKESKKVNTKTNPDAEPSRNRNKGPNNKKEQTKQLKQTSVKDQSLKLHHEAYPGPSSPFKSQNKKFFQSQFSSGKKQQLNLNELQNINLSKIEKNMTENNEQDDMQKSSFHQNIEEHLRQIRTHRSFQEQDMNNEEDISRQYLNQLGKMDKQPKGKHLDNNQFRKKDKFAGEYQDLNKVVKHVNILESSPFKESSPLRQKSCSEDSGNEPNSSQEEKEQMAQEQDQDYEQKCRQVERRRIQRENERREFMNRMKHQFKPIMNPSQQDGAQSDEDNQHYSDEGQRSSEQEDDYKSQRYPIGNQRSGLRQQSHCEVNDTERSEDLNQQPKYQPSHSYPQQSDKNTTQPFNPSSFTKLPLRNNFQQISPLNHPQQPDCSYNESKSILNQVPKQNEDCSFVSSTSSGEFKYRQVNQEKLSYMLKSTSNPYQHLRNLILIPFKGSHKKHQFLKELLHFFTNHVEFKIPQPYTSLILLTILMFSEIKQDKTLIQPLQLLYEFLAKQSTTNDFIKTIVNLFHTVIEQTLPQNRKFLITILLKSMIRMLPFIEDGLSLLRDIQQFYQIGQMVYFEMFEEEYTQIKTYMEDEAVHIVVERALEQQGHNLVAIVEGWLGTEWKNKVIETIQEFQLEHSDTHEHQNQHQNEEHHHNYQSYI